MQRSWQASSSWMTRLIASSHMLYIQIHLMEGDRVGRKGIIQ